MNTTVLLEPLRLRVCLFLGLLIVCAVPADAQDRGPEVDILKQPNWRESSLSVGDLTRWYLVYAPESLPETSPVVVLLHGGLGSMRMLFNPRIGGPKEWVHLADRERFLLVVPNGTNVTTGETKGDRQGWNVWNAGHVDGSDTFRGIDDVRFFDSLLDRIEQDYSIDRTRVYVTGGSEGGMMVYRLLAEIPERFAAGAAFIANLPVSEPPFAKPVLPTPLMIANGRQDKIVKWEGGQILTGPRFVISAEATVAWWVDANHARAENPSSEYLPDRNPADECRVLRTEYAADGNGAPVVFYTLEGQGHSMPTIAHAREPRRGCQAVEGARLAWEFLKNYKRSGNRAQVETALGAFAAELSANPPATEEAPARIRAYLEDHPEFFGSTVAFIGPDGRVFYSPYVYRHGSGLAEKDLVSPEYDPDHQKWLTEPLHGRKAVWSQPYFDAGGGEIWMVTYSVPLLRDSTVFAVVTTDLPVDPPE